MNFRPMGVELTAIPKMFRNCHGDILEQPWYPRVRFDPVLGLENSRQRLHRSVNAFGLDYFEKQSSNQLIAGAHLDIHCVEIASPILWSMSALERWSLRTREYFQEIDCEPKHPEAVCGGAHIHVGSLGAPLTKKLIKDLIMRPYLPWIFGEPDDTESMCSYTGCIALVNVYKNNPQLVENNSEIEIRDRTGRGGMFETNEIKALAWVTGNYLQPTSDKNIKDWFNSKSAMFSWTDYNTLEFRFFEMTSSWEEQRLQTEFVMAYIDWVARQPTTKVVLMDYKQLLRIRPEACVEQFSELCWNIGVDVDDYVPFIKRNLFPRWTNGRKRV